MPDDLESIINGLVQDAVYEATDESEDSTPAPTQPTTPQLNDTWMNYYLAHGNPQTLQTKPVQAPVSPKWGAQNPTRSTGQPRIPWGNQNRGDNR